MTEKSFATCFDKGCEQFAEILMTLVSKDDRICNIKTSREEFKKDRGIVSGEYVLTIGEKSSAVQRANFPDKYNAYGIHIGFYGHKAWISCDSVNWSWETEHKFLSEMKELLTNNNMLTTNIEREIAEIEEFMQNEALTKQSENAQTSVLDYINPLEYIKPILELSMIAGYWAKDLLVDSKTRKEWQYTFGVVLFYQKYLNDFLKLSETASEEAEF